MRKWSSQLTALPSSLQLWEGKHANPSFAPPEPAGYPNQGRHAGYLPPACPGTARGRDTQAGRQRTGGNKQACARMPQPRRQRTWMMRDLTRYVVRCSYRRATWAASAEIARPPSPAKGRVPSMAGLALKGPALSSSRSYLAVGAVGAGGRFGRLCARRRSHQQQRKPGDLCARRHKEAEDRHEQVPAAAGPAALLCSQCCCCCAIADSTVHAAPRQGHGAAPAAMLGRVASLTGARSGECAHQHSHAYALVRTTRTYTPPCGAGMRRSLEAQPDGGVSGDEVRALGHSTVHVELRVLAVP